MDSDDEKPFNEQQWQDLFKRSEARSARFGELLETLLDHPDREAIIAREMGWDRDGTPEIEFETDDDQPSFGPDEFEDDSAADEDWQPVEKRPEYRLAHAVGLKIHRALKPYMQALDANEPADRQSEERAERLQSAYINSLIPAAKIAAGNGMGEEDEALCGQIVCLRKALEASETARADLDWLAAQNVLPGELVNQHGAQLDEVSAAIRVRIDELRARVWWD